VSEVERDSEAGTAMAMFRKAVELGNKGNFPFELLRIPESFQHRADFRLFLMDLRMPDDPFIGP
jgi:hypothetical protein